MPDSLNELGILLAAFLPNLLLAILVLVVGWLIALGISKLFESLLHRTSLDDRLAGMLRGGSPDRVPAERWISKVIFWVIMIFVLLIFLQMLNLGVVAAPINDLLSQVLTYIPKILAAAVLILLAVVIGAVLRVIITRLLSASGLSQRLSENAQVDSRNRITIGQTMGNVVFWLVILLFLPAILDTLDLQGILAPVQGMVDSILGALPNILGAIVVLAVGWLVARIIRAIVGNLLASTGIDSLGDRTGVQNVMREQRLSDVIAMIVFVLIMIPVVIAALNVLDIPAVSEPAANMLNSLLTALPAIFGAFLILAVAYFVGRLVAQLVSSLLAGIGFNRLFSAGGPIAVTGLLRRDDPTRPDIPVTGAADMPMSGGTLQRTQPSDVVGWIVLVAILLFAVLQASQMLGFDALTALISAFIAAAGNILFGLIIFGVGLWLSGMAYRMIRNTGETGNTEILATTARVAIIVFAAALALQQMGIAESIVNLAFGLMLGAVAVAAAIAFGVGGRDVARDLLERWRGQLREQANRPAPPPPPPPSIPRTGQNVNVPPAPSDFDSDTRPIRRPDNQPFDEPGSFTDRIDRPDDVEDNDLPPV